MGCWWRWAIWVLQRTGAASWRLEVSWMISLTVSTRDSFQNGTTRMQKTWLNISVGKSYRPQHAALFALNLFHGESQETTGYLKHGYLITMDSSVCWSCWRADSYRTCLSPFTNFRASFGTFSNASASRDKMGYSNSIFKMWPDKKIVQGEKNDVGKGREGSFQIKQYSTRFIGNADDIIFSTANGV